ncbi:hypothetical protein Acsp03_50310 [Actinomadura sp. NBRC 104412]|nr:hypothetical protein Acsp03_50310 [Actinomadura sp. NBRC 104412]
MAIGRPGSRRAATARTDSGAPRRLIRPGDEVRTIVDPRNTLVKCHLTVSATPISGAEDGDPVGRSVK